MKPLHEVEATRKAYHQSRSGKTVHRSSLLVLAVPGADTIISFLNHFLLKRDYKNVACKVTAIDGAGGFVDSLTIEISEPRVYTINLDAMFESKAANYLVEFFSENNLFIPFPAVMVNHRGADFCNVVHSYNRVLNDVFEDDAINKHQVGEASIDFVNTSDAETFANVASGIFSLNGELVFEYRDGDTSITKNVPINMRRLSNRRYCVSEIFPELHARSGGVLKILQPKQAMFYGRMLVGTSIKGSNAFAANHSYYDCSDTREYWDNSASYRCYPFFKEFGNRIRMYPIMSPGQIEVRIEVLAGNGIRISDKYDLISPSSDHVDIDVNKLIDELEVRDASAYTLFATAKDGTKIPTRVNNQLVLSDIKKSSRLAASINIALDNVQSFVPGYRTGYTWGQMVSGADYTSNAGLCFRSSSGDGDNVEIEFFSERGSIATRKEYLAPGMALIIAPDEVVPEQQGVEFIWYIAKSKRNDLSAYSFHVNKVSGNASGEHGF